MTALLDKFELAELFARANAAADLEKIAGVKLKRSGKRLRGPCPLCGGDKDSTRFWADPRIKRWGCFGGCKGGDAVALYAELSRLSPIEAARELAGVSPALNSPRQAPAAVRPAAGPPRDADDAWKAQLASRMWAEGRPAAGTPVEAYLAGRGISGEPLASALRQLRFHPKAYHHGPDRQAVTAPAMLGLVRSPLGRTGGLHVTYLAPGGRGKAKFDAAKRMWGPQGLAPADGPPSPGGVWLTNPEAAGNLIVAEGIESALSAALLIGGPCRIVAALSLGHLQGGWLLDKWGRLDPVMVRPDPDRPAFTWPEPKVAPWGVVVLAVDRDMKPITVKVRKARGGTAKRELEAEARARICAGLAEANWRRAGATAVRIIAPQPGRDFNDELQARLASGWRAAA